MALGWDELTVDLPAGSFDENTSIPSTATPQHITGGGFGILQQSGASFTVDPKVTITFNGVNGSSSWRVAGFTPVPIKLKVYIVYDA